MTQTLRASFDRHVEARVPSRDAGAGVADASRTGIQLSLHGDLAAVEADWRAFEKLADCTAFQSFDWLSTWQRNIGAGEGVMPAIVVGHHAGAIVFIMPLALTAGPLRRVTWFGDYLCNANAPLLAPDFAKRISRAQFPVLWREIEQLLRKQLRHDVIDLSKMPERVGAQENPMLALGLTASPNDAYVINLTGNWDEFYAAKRSASRRKTDGRKRRKLEKEGAVTFAVATERADIERTIDALIAQKKTSYASLGVVNMFEWPGYRDFFIDLASDPSRHGLVHVSSVSVNETIVAASFGLTMHGNYDYVLAGYTMGEYDTSSPGTIHLQELMRHFMERGFKTFDLNIGFEPYKQEWCDVETKMYDYIAPATWRGWTAASLTRASRAVKRFIKRNPSIWPVIRKMRSMIGALR